MLPSTYLQQIHEHTENEMKKIISSTELKVFNTPICTYEYTFIVYLGRLRDESFIKIIPKA